MVFFGYLEDLVSISELSEIENSYDKVIGMDSDVIVCSLHSHYRILNFFEKNKKQGIEDLKYPILSDLTLQIFYDFGLIYMEEKILKNQGYF